MCPARLALSLALCLALLSGCREDPRTPQYWHKALERAGRAEERERVVEGLRQSGYLAEGFLPLLHAQLASEKKPEVRAALVRAIGDVRSRASVQPLIAALDLGATGLASHLVNKAIATALADIGDTQAGPALVPLLRTGDNYSRIEAMRALGTLRTPEAVEPLLQLAVDEGVEPFLNKKAIEALGHIGDARAVPVLMRLLTQERRRVSFYAESSFALFQLGAPAADALLAALEERDAELSRWAQAQDILPASYTFKAAQILGDLRDTRAERRLLELLAFTHPEESIQALVRVQAAEALGRMRSAAAIKPLAALVAEPDPGVREGYVHALVLLGGREALPALEKAAASGPWESREQAVRGLALLGDARELPLLGTLAHAEPARAQAECERGEASGCEDLAALLQERQHALGRHQAVLEAAQACQPQPTCWTHRLADKEALVVERAALELGRGGSAEQVPALTSRLDTRDTRARRALIQAVDWLAGDSPQAASRAREALPQLEQQLARERGGTEFARVNEDLRRLLVRLRRPASTTTRPAP